VEDTTVVTALMSGHRLLLVEHQHRDTLIALDEGSSDREPNESGADDTDVVTGFTAHCVDLR
jgi:hypothetical protein